jgi:succinate dehydrogenase/fumarate reductase flavoprotein subunit
MRGNVQRITFLDRETTPTPNPSGTIAQSNNAGEEVTPTPVTGQSTGEKLMTALRRAGLAAFLAFLALIGLVFAITKARG